MPSFRTAFPSKYMKVSDLNGRAIVATIASVDLESVGEDNKYVARFTENGVKPVVLNLTNSTTIAEITGSEDVEDWPGHRIEIFPSSTDYQGKRVACIRLRAPRQAKPARPTTAPPAPRRGSAKAASDPDDVDEAMPATEGEY